MKGLILTRRDGERIVFTDDRGHIGCITVVMSEFNRVSLQLEFRAEVRIQRAELSERGVRLDKRA